MQFVRKSENESMNILVTSSMGGEGKTTVSNHLGRAFARAGYRTLIIDTNLTWPPIHMAKVGLAEFLRGERELRDIMTRSSVDNLYSIDAGVSDSESRELLCSRRMWELVQLTGEAFDYVIFDGPAVLANNDVLILSEISDQAVLVIDSELTDKRQARDALEKLERNNSKVRGIVLNRTKGDSEQLYSEATS